MNEPGVLQQLLQQAVSLTGLEIMAFVLGVICVWQTVRENPWCWITGTAQVAVLGYVVFRAGLYADFVLQILYVVLNGYGLYQWLYGGEKRSKLKISNTSLLGHIIIFSLILPVLTLSIAYLLRHLQTDSKTLYLDAFTTSLSLVAQVMLSRKKLENWFVWITANILYIGLYSYKELYFLAAMQVPFIALSLRGWWCWRKSYVANAGVDIMQVELAPEQ